MRVRFRIKLRDKSSCGKTVERNGWGKWNKLQEWRWGIGWIWKIVDFTLYPPYLPHTRLTETETVPVRTAARWWLFWSQKITGQGTYFFSTNNQGVRFFQKKKSQATHYIAEWITGHKHFQEFKKALGADFFLCLAMMVGRQISGKWSWGDYN